MLLDRTMDDLIANHEISQFLYREARLLDEADYGAWAELLDDDIEYIAPQAEFTDRPNNALDHIGSHHFQENKDSILNRIDWLSSGFSSSETPQPIRNRIIANIMITSREGDDFEVSSQFQLIQSRWDGTQVDFSGRREDKLRRTGDGLRIFRRVIYLSTPVLPRALTTFL